MEIKCRKCAHTYDCAAQEACPNCGTVNSAFRSSAGRKLGNTAALGDHGWADHLNQRAERLSHEKKPGFFKNLMPYLQIIIVVFAVGMAGSLLTRYAKTAPSRLPGASAQIPVDRPAITELASAAFDARFQPWRGVQLTVTCTGALDRSLVGEQMKKDEQCVFVNITATVADREALGDFFTPPYLVCNGETVRPVDLRGTADLHDYTPFDYTLLREYNQVSGQLFFILPIEEKNFSMRVPGGEGIEQETRLHI